MVELQQPHLMPHALDPPPFPPWPTTKHAPRILPPPPSQYLEAHPPSRPAFSFSSSGQLTPPSTSEMNSTVLRQVPMQQPSQRGEELRYPIRSQPQASQAPAYPYASNNVPSHFNSSQSHASSTLNRSPLSLSSLVQPEPSETRKSPTSSSSVAPGLKLPRTINAPQTSLPQLAAEVTCLFWFENGATLKRIENLPSNATSYPVLGPDSTPNISFRKWVATLLSTTQVTPNVVLLALLFIYKLKSFNWTVKGKPGSEYRLLTVALMLGNKFLDDNTYTNKTWADVSGISVQEVHIMEVEFLSNMRYSLFTSTKDWNDWHIKLGKFGTFIDRVSKSWENGLRPGTMNTASMHVPAALPSPPVSNNASPPFTSNHSPSHMPRSNTPILLPTLSSTAVSPIGPLPELDPRFSGRKRSYDESGQEPPPKRHAPFYPLPQIGSSNVGQMPSSQVPTLPRVSLPSLSIPPVSHAPAPMQLAPQLPPPGARAMSMVYPPPAQWSHQTSVPTSVPSLQSTALPPPNAVHVDQSRQLSPYPGHSATSSPVSATFTPTTQGSTRLSPSYFLSQRSSPYRPVRQVQTLLVPPASASMHNAPKLVAHDQMQYHPLGRPMTERRVGHLPYMNHDAWPETHQFNQWPDLPPPPQPVFH